MLAHQYINNIYSAAASLLEVFAAFSAILCPHCASSVWLDMQAVGVVCEKRPPGSQDTVLFNDTIFYNIAYGNVHATKQEVEEAARMADLEKVILRMPLGYETQVYCAYLNTSYVDLAFSSV
jgi:hypothetical protein